MMDRFCMGCMEPLEDWTGVCPRCGYPVRGLPIDYRYLPPGTVLEERYIIGRILGVGNLSATYLGYDRVLNKKLAIKEYLPRGLSTRAPMHQKLTIYSGDREERFLDGRNKFVDEARRLAKFQNVPGIVHVYGCFETNRTAYIRMEYLEGETLEELLDREGNVSVKQAFPIILDILHSLEAVHREGILHRDISPKNIFITRNGEVKLLNFNAARFADTNRDRGLTVLVKPGFAPEEQYHSRGNQGPWTDVYAVAATFYRMISGIMPEEALERIVGDTLKKPSSLGVEIGPGTETALMNAMNISIEYRTQTAKQFEDELLANVVKRMVVKKKRVDVRRWPPWARIVIGAGVVGIGFFEALIAAGVIHFGMAVWSGSSIPEGMCRVPNVVNEKVEDAIERGEQAGLSVRIYGEHYSREIPANRVLSQSIKGGSVVALNETLGLVVSTDIATCVPEEAVSP